jgi:hypothetical protein
VDPPLGHRAARLIRDHDDAEDVDAVGAPHGLEVLHLHVLRGVEVDARGQVRALARELHESAGDEHIEVGVASVGERDVPVAGCFSMSFSSHLRASLSRTRTGPSFYPPQETTLVAADG